MHHKSDSPPSIPHKRKRDTAPRCKTYEQRASVKIGPGGGMVDALVSGASAARRAGSSPVLGTHKSRKLLTINSYGIFYSIFVSKLSANPEKFAFSTQLNVPESN